MAKCVASVYASVVDQYIKKLNCPSEQKVQLLDMLIQSVSAEDQRGGTQKDL